MKKLLLTAIFAALPALTGCTSLSVYQTGKTLPKGKTQFGVGAGAMSDPKTVTTADDDETLFSGDMWVRYGFTDRVDAGAKLSLPGAATADVRYGFLNENRQDRFSLAGGITATRTLSETGHISLTLIDLMLPLYISKDIAPWLTVYGVPRYSYRTIKTELYGNAVSDTLSMWGLGGGVMFNFGPDDRLHLAVEYHRLQSFSRPGYYSATAGCGLSCDF